MSIWTVVATGKAKRERGRGWSESGEKGGGKGGGVETIEGEGRR